MILRSNYFELSILWMRQSPMLNIVKFRLQLTKVLFDFAQDCLAHIWFARAGEIIHMRGYFSSAHRQSDWRKYTHRLESRTTVTDPNVTWLPRVWNSINPHPGRVMSRHSGTWSQVSKPSMVLRIVVPPTSNTPSIFLIGSPVNLLICLRVTPRKNAWPTSACQMGHFSVAAVMQICLWPNRYVVDE